MSNSFQEKFKSYFTPQSEVASSVKPGFRAHAALFIGGAAWLESFGIAVGATIAAIEICTVLILRAHYAMDVFTGAVAALWVWTVASYLAPKLDSLVAALLL